MEPYKSYQHIEKLDSPEVDGILSGQVDAFYKLDGTNGKIWFEDGSIQYGSRKRILSIDDDNAGFAKISSEDEAINSFFSDEENRNYILFGEFLTNGNIKTYQDSAKKKFFIFDVCLATGKNEEQDEKFKYLPYDEYVPILKKYNLRFIERITTLTNPKKEDCEKLLELTGNFLIVPGCGKGEGIVLKNYGYRNNYGRQTWAKIVDIDFKQEKRKKAKEIIGDEIESEIAFKFVSESFVEKEFLKLTETEIWSQKMIPKFLGICMHEFIKDNIEIIIKKYRFPTINFKKLKFNVESRIKFFKGNLF